MHRYLKQDLSQLHPELSSNLAFPPLPLILLSSQHGARLTWQNLICLTRIQIEWDDSAYRESI